MKTKPAVRRPKPIKVSSENNQPIPTGGPQFGESAPTRDPSKFTVQHGSDKEAYTILDHERGKLPPRAFPVVRGVAEPKLDLAEALGSSGDGIISQIEKAGQIVFHSLGDTGNTHGPKDQSLVADKMVSDYSDVDSKSVPSFLYHLGDVVYSFGETEYYYDQFYEQYRDYPAPIFAVPGNHDGMVAPNSSTPTLKAFLENFCTAGQKPHRTPESGALDRTAQIQPAVYFTLDSPFVRILGLYSNCLEGPGIISSEGAAYPQLGTTQVDYLKAALQRVKDEKFKGAVVVAVHHPPYVAQISLPGNKSQNAGKHGGSPRMLKDIDAACAATGIWPHAVLSGHAHNYQRFTRYKEGRETPYLVSGNGGHGVTHLTRKGTPTIRVPVAQPSLAAGGDNVTFDNYDDQDFGYLRVIVNSEQLRIEYHPATDGAEAKTPDDNVTVDLATRKIVHYRAR